MARKALDRPTMALVVSFALGFGSPQIARAATDCAGWPTDRFWETAVAEDVERCLAAGARTETYPKVVACLRNDLNIRGAISIASSILSNPKSAAATSETPSMDQCRKGRL